MTYAVSGHLLSSLPQEASLSCSPSPLMPSGFSAELSLPSESQRPSPLSPTAPTLSSWVLVGPNRHFWSIDIFVLLLIFKLSFLVHSFLLQNYLIYDYWCLFPIKRCLALFFSGPCELRSWGSGARPCLLHVTFQGVSASIFHPFIPIQAP
jgi:hypothetical protein